MTTHVSIKSVHNHAIKYLRPCMRHFSERDLFLENSLPQQPYLYKLFSKTVPKWSGVWCCSKLKVPKLSRSLSKKSALCVRLFWKKYIAIQSAYYSLPPQYFQATPKKTAGKWQKCNLVSGKASVASDMGWLRTGWIGPAPVQMSGMLSVRRAVVIVRGLFRVWSFFHWPLVSS